MVQNEIVKAREALRIAIADHEMKRQAYDRATAAEKRAHGLVADAQARLGQAQDAAHKAAVGRAERIKAAIGEGSDAPAAVIDLRLSRSVRMEAEDDLAAAIETQRMLTAEKVEAEKALAAASETVKQSAAKVMTAEADVLADELLAVQKRKAELHGLLMALSYLPRVDGAGPWPLTSNVLNALHWQEPMHAGTNDPLKARTRAWVQYAAALAGDADAKFTPSFTLNLSARLAAE